MQTWFYPRPHHYFSSDLQPVNSPMIATRGIIARRCHTYSKLASSQPRAGVELVERVVVVALLQEGRVGGAREVALVVQQVQDTYWLLAQELNHWKQQKYN